MVLVQWAELAFSQVGLHSDPFRLRALEKEGELSEERQQKGEEHDGSPNHGDRKKATFSDPPPCLPPPPPAPFFRFLFKI